MNRREVLATLAGLPAVASVKRLDVEPGQVLVFECETAVSHDAVRHIERTVQAILPGVKCLVLSEGMKLSVMKVPK